MQLVVGTLEGGDVSLCVKEMGSLKESLMRRVTCNTRETREVSESDCKGYP